MHTPVGGNLSKFDRDNRRFVHATSTTGTRSHARNYYVWARHKKRSLVETIFVNELAANTPNGPRPRASLSDAFPVCRRPLLFGRPIYRLTFLRAPPQTDSEPRCVLAPVSIFVVLTNVFCTTQTAPRPKNQRVLSYTSALLHRQ